MGPAVTQSSLAGEGRRAEGLVVKAVCGLAAQTGSSEGTWKAAVVWAGSRTRRAFLGAGGWRQAVAVSTETRPYLPLQQSSRPG